MRGHLLGFVSGAAVSVVALGASALLSPLRLPPHDMAQEVAARPAQAEAAPAADVAEVGAAPDAALRPDLPQRAADAPATLDAATPMPSAPPVQTAPLPQTAPAPVALPSLPQTSRPIEAYAAPTAPVIGRALAIVMIDDGMMVGGPQAVAALPMPVTIAIDPSRADATDKMNAYRAMGIEVVALLRLEGAGPTAVFAAQHALPQAVAVMDVDSAEIGTGAANALREAGLGLISMGEGTGDLQHAQITAQLPSTASSPIVLAREISGLAASDQDAVFLTRLRPVVIAALRAGTLPTGFVPVSALLRD
ncbi:hypothetical protein [Ketogulonicigenium vulgare]|uniref:hypothetical protein n=3 Tax=Ketogulonicigenium vulgare TaxID=92945 RepID=UPI0007062EF3|nr:hypothetical protein [Ketogulonicigenium vulgare]ALJ80636.1 hypothetical protein KVH_05260 [Ketogulonicigenium vulgare]ANW33453.1 hypothetical protein KvSKV_05230 [Ketogulonicigenium vulgare]AOZ54167.1 Divergent polysaccharide deacetylase family [Ketogulonicigenium vulgare]